MIPLGKPRLYRLHTGGHTLEDLHLRARIKKELSPENFSRPILEENQRLLREPPTSPVLKDQTSPARHQRNLLYPTE